MTNNPFMNGGPQGGPPKSPVAPKAPKATAAPMPGTSAPAAGIFEVDLTNVQSGFVIPDGLYRVRCIECEQGVSQAGNPQFIWTFVIVDKCDVEGRDFKSFTAITPAAMWKVAEHVIALGVGEIGDVVKFVRSDVVGKECGAFIEESEYNGNVRSSISKVIPLNDLAKARA